MYIALISVQGCLSNGYYRNKCTVTLWGIERGGYIHEEGNAT